MDSTITVMGATGNTGRQITASLLRDGHMVRALGRSERKLAELAGAGADVRIGDITDLDFLADAFRGADAAYTLLPTDRRAPDYRAQQDREGEAIVRAIRVSGLRYVVALSSVGGDVGEGLGVIAGLHAQEQRLGTLGGTNVLILRPVSFFENFYDQLEVVKHAGVVSDVVEPDLAIPMVAARDVAAAATEALVARDWSGVVVRELLGPRDISYREATHILGEHIGKPDLAYVQVSEAEMVSALVAAGLSASFAQLYVEMTRAFNERRARPLAGRTPDNTTPTRFEDFAPELAAAYGNV